MGGCGGCFDVSGCLSFEKSRLLHLFCFLNVLKGFVSVGVLMFRDVLSVDKS